MIALRMREEWARALVALGKKSTDYLVQKACEQLRRALTPSSSRAGKKTTAKQRRTASVRRQVVERVRRNDGLCECGCGRQVVFQDGSDCGHMDHFRGRVRVPETLASCWLLHSKCDRAKTDNQPSAVAWLVAFLKHSKRNGLKGPAQDDAQARLEAMNLQALIPGVLRG